MEMNQDFGNPENGKQTESHPPKRLTDPGHSMRSAFRQSHSQQQRRADFGMFAQFVPFASIAMFVGRIQPCQISLSLLSLHDHPVRFYLAKFLKRWILTRTDCITYAPPVSIPNVLTSSNR